MQIKTESKLVLSTGHVVKADCNIIGISPELLVYGGYEEDSIDLKMSPGERIELAEYAIDLWMRYRFKACDMMNARGRDEIRV